MMRETVFIDLLSQALGRWFGDEGANHLLAEYEDLRLFVDATTRSVPLPSMVRLPLFLTSLIDAVSSQLTLPVPPAS